MCTDKMFRFVVLASLLSTAAALHPRLDGRIVGGEAADIEDFPYQLSLQSYSRHICGASLIGAKWAVTAAHCTDGSPTASLSLIAGITNLKQQGQSIQIKVIHQHPDFSISDLDSDVSVLELATEVVLGASVQPVALAAAGSDPTAGTDATCTGWGTLYEGGPNSNRLQKVTVQVVDRRRCQGQYDTGLVTDNMICTGVSEGGKNACQGDSGGPLVADGKLIGIVSWAYGCGRPDYSGVYSNVGALRSYIKEISGI